MDSPGGHPQGSTHPAQQPATPPQEIPLHSVRPYPREPRVSRAFLVMLVAATVAVFLLITLGGVVRVSGSGLGCPDWPLCHGKLVPPLDFNTLVEYSHRLAGALTSSLVILVSVVAWWRYRRAPLIVVPLTLTLGLLVTEVVLGGITVLAELPPTIVTIHLATAQFIFALLLTTTLWASRALRATSPAVNPSAYTWAAAAIFATILSGSYIVGRGVGSACPGWPLCDSGLLPSNGQAWLHMGHRIIAGAGALVGAWAVLNAWRHRGTSKAIGLAGAIGATLLVAQTLVGAINPWTGFSAIGKGAHLSLATAVWGSFVALVALAWQPGVTSTQGKGSLWSVVAAYVALTKPAIILLLLITALGGMFLATQGTPPLSAMVLVLVGGALGAGGANALNHYFDLDIDAAMRRTQRRPLPAHKIPPRNALAFGVLLNALAFIILGWGVNLLSAGLTLGASVFYVLVYTLWLKRSTPQNIVIGGAAGAVPPLVGWAAVTGGLDLSALYLFAIVFFWTPPHFWALSLLLRQDYTRAGVPMLPVVAGIHETTRSILLHSLILVSITIMFATVGPVGWTYLAGATVLGAYFLLLAWRLFRTQALGVARHLYLYSLLYLALLFALMILGTMASSLP